MSIESVVTQGKMSEVTDDFRLRLSEIMVTPEMELGFLVEKCDFDGSIRTYSLATTDTADGDSINESFSQFLHCLGLSREPLESIFNEKLDETKNDIRFWNSYKVGMEWPTSCENVVIGIRAEVDWGTESGRVWYLRNTDKKPVFPKKFFRFSERR